MRPIEAIEYLKEFLIRPEQMAKEFIPPINSAEDVICAKSRLDPTTVIYFGTLQITIVYYGSPYYSETRYTYDEVKELKIDLFTKCLEAHV